MNTNDEIDLKQVVRKYGLTGDGDGAFAFLLGCRAYKHYDEGMRALFPELERRFLEPINGAAGEAFHRRSSASRS